MTPIEAFDYAHIHFGWFGELTPAANAASLLLCAYGAAMVARSVLLRRSNLDKTQPAQKA
jgi:L-lysine 2,3-aminomutase